MFEVETVKPYSEDYFTCTKEAKDELHANARPQIKRFSDGIDEYDNIFVGYPNWWGTMPMAMFTFLEHYDLKGKKIINPAYDLERVRHWHDRRTRGTFPPLRKGRSGHIGYETFSRRTFRRTTEIPCVEQKRARLFCNRRIYAEICRR